MAFPLVAVIVTFQPDITRLKQLLNSCALQTDATVIIDNGDGITLSKDLDLNTSDTLLLLAMGENRGVGAAQNAGIAWARAHDATYVLLLDQDSALTDDLAPRLVTAMQELSQTGHKVAAVGPRHLDTRWNKDPDFSPFITYMHGCIRRIKPQAGARFVAVDWLISSGSLISLAALGTIGGMDEILFIDYVDTEWCARAKAAGWSLYGVWDIIMSHDLGDNRMQAMGRTLAIRSPVRHYYAMRNAVFLCLHRCLPCGWKLAIAGEAASKFLVYSMFMPKALLHFGHMCLGVCHGIIGRMGRK